jgi:hypothetical protein
MLHQGCPYLVEWQHQSLCSISGGLSGKPLMQASHTKTLSKEAVGTKCFSPLVGNKVVTRSDLVVRKSLVCHAEQSTVKEYGFGYR